MKKLLLLCCTLAALTNAIPAKAQFGRMLENAINRNINKKIDEAVDKTFEEGTKQSKKDTNASTKTEKTNEEIELNTNESGSVEIKTRDSKTVISDESIKIDNSEQEITIEQNTEKPTNVLPSKFIGSFDMETLITNKKGKQEKMLMQYYINTYQNAMVIKSEDKTENMRMIFDRQEGTITTFDDEQKKAMVMRSPKVTVKNKNGQTVNNDFPTYQQTGKTKVINGYTCYENVAEDESMKLTTWITKEIDIDLSESMNFGMKNKKHQIPANLQGVALETTFVDKEDGSTVVTMIKNIAKGLVNQNMFSTTGYQVTDMRSMGFGRQ